MTLIILDMINFDVTVEIKELAKNHAHSYLGNSVQTPKPTKLQMEGILSSSSGKVFLVIAPIKAVLSFGRKGKLSSSFVRLFWILERVGQVAHHLTLPPTFLRVHNPASPPYLPPCLLGGRSPCGYHPRASLEILFEVDKQILDTSWRSACRKNYTLHVLSNPLIMV